MNASEAIRPRAEFLKTLPTLAVETSEDDNPAAELARKEGIEYRLELKLVTPKAIYWLCTKGIPTPKWREVFYEGWTVGYVTAEYLEPNEEGFCERKPYGPDEVNRLQGMDYLNMLVEERDRVDKNEEAEPTLEGARRLEAIRDEIEKVMAILKPKRG